MGAHSDAVPEAFRGLMTMSHGKSVHTMAKRLNQFESFDAVVLLGVLFGGGLPWAFKAFEAAWGLRPGRWDAMFSGRPLVLLTQDCFSWYTVPLGGTVWLQHHYRQALVDGPAEGPAVAVVLAYPIGAHSQTIEWTERAGGCGPQNRFLVQLLIVLAPMTIFRFSTAARAEA